jgi:hypothetical protein
MQEVPGSSLGESTKSSLSYSSAFRALKSERRVLHAPNVRTFVGACSQNSPWPPLPPAGYRPAFEITDEFVRIKFSEATRAGVG